MPIGRAITLFLIDGTPDGRVACELINRVGKCVKIPRRLMKESSNREELWKAGVYFLFGRDETSAETNRVYVGEAEEVMKRLPQHNEKEFWSEALVFFSKDDYLNKAHIKFLEHTICERVAEVGRFQLENGNTPNRPMISEMEQAVMSECFEDLQLLVGSLGYKLFEPIISIVVKEQSTEYFSSSARGANARAIYTNEGMVVMKGSVIATSIVTSAPEGVQRLRVSLQSDGTLVEQNSVITFAKDYLFSSPSAASGFIQGRSCNGWIEWKDATGRTLKENEQ